MTRFARRTVVILLLASAVVVTAAQQMPVFRSQADAVFVDVSVAKGRKPVAGLAVSDFALQDDGVDQVIDDVVSETASVDVTILLDTSGSVAGVGLGGFEDRLVQGTRDLVKGLRPTDRVELVTVDRQIRRTRDLTAWTREAPARIGDGGTVLLDAIVAALMEREDPGRRHVIIALTDGLDTQSLITREERQAVIARSNAVVHIVAISLLGRTSGQVSGRCAGLAPLPSPCTTASQGDYDHLFREITDATGGQFYDLRPGVTFVGSLTNEIDRFRQYYTLRYRPSQVAHSGWHSLTVRLQARDYDVHARRGYFAR